MEIKWANVVAFGLAIFGLVLGVTLHRQIGGFLGTMTAIGPGHAPEEQTIGLIAFGLVAISLLGLIKIVLHANREDR